MLLLNAERGRRSARRERDRALRKEEHPRKEEQRDHGHIPRRLAFDEIIIDFIGLLREKLGVGVCVAVTRAPLF